MSDSAYINLIRGTRLKLYAGIDTDKYTEIKYSKDYTYAEFKVESLYVVDADGKAKSAKQAKAGDQVRMTIACGTVTPERNYKVLTEATPEMYDLFRAVHLQRIRENGDVGPVTLSGTLDRDITLASLGGAVRLYLQA